MSEQRYDDLHPNATADEILCLGVGYFRTVWTVCAKVGVCDEYGSVECVRLYALWVKDNRPVPLSAWIERHANAAPLEGQDHA